MERARCKSRLSVVWGECHWIRKEEWERESCKISYDAASAVAHFETSLIVSTLKSIHRFVKFIKKVKCHYFFIPHNVDLGPVLYKFHD